MTNRLYLAYVEDQSTDINRLKSALNKTADLFTLTLTDDAACLHSVLINLHQVVGQVAQLWLHTLRPSRILTSQSNQQTKADIVRLEQQTHFDIQQVGERVHVVDSVGVPIPQLVEHSQSLVNI